MSHASGTPSFLCTLTADLGPPQQEGDQTLYDGSLTVNCGDGIATGIAFLAETGFPIFPLVFGAHSPDVPGVAGPLYDCGWVAFSMSEGQTITGEWQPSDTCENTDFSGGQLTLRFQG